MQFWTLMAQNGGAAAWGIGGVMLLWAVLAVAAVGIWLWALIDAIQNPALDSTMRIIWVLVILFTQIIGAIIYLAIGRSMGRRAPGPG
jgi:peptidoglycan biosynthesis protein MviN/MurJ (putative lipid II flippase)